MQKETEPSETQMSPQSQTELEKKTVGLTLPFMETKDYVSFQPEARAQSASLSLKIPADWAEDTGLLYGPSDSSNERRQAPWTRIFPGWAPMNLSI